MKISKTNDAITPSLQRIQRDLQRVPEQTYREWVKNTPVRSGNARRRTRLENNKTINARYPYARQLDQGSSRQAPQGMSRPALNYMKQLLRRILRK
jgi:hypothetical protein